MLNFINLLTASVTMPGGTNEVATQAANAVSEVATEATSAASIFGMQMGKGGSTAILILYIAALALVFYFFAVRPQKKRAAQLSACINSKFICKKSDNVISFWCKYTLWQNHRVH